MFSFANAGILTTYCEPITVPPPIRDTPPHPGLLLLVFTNSVWVSSTSHGICMCKGCETGPMVHHPSPIKTRKFNHYFVSFTCMHNFGEQTRQVSRHVPGLSLRAGGWGFLPATVNLAPGYFHRKIEEK